MTKNDVLKSACVFVGRFWESKLSCDFSREVVGIASLDRKLYVALKGETSIHVIDLLSGQTLRTVAVTDIRSGTILDMASGTYSTSIRYLLLRKRYTGWPKK